MFNSYIQDLEKDSATEKPGWVKAIIWLTLTCFTMQPVLSLAQTVITPANNATQITTTQDPGRALINIAKPNGAGVSNNTYNQFDVGNKGAVLNNNSSGQNVTIPGVVGPNGQVDIAPHNANLNSGSANLIINQVVNSGPPSQLNGFLAVAGQRAGVIVANPNGITCQGCGFINTTRGVLTTGQPQFDANGNLDRLSVTGGTLTIGKLIDFATPQIDLAAMSILINGSGTIQGPNDINGKPTTVGALNLIGGANNINYADLKATPTNSAPNGQVAIDIRLLGGMYAQQITLVSTNKGAGVNSAGTIYSANDLTIAGDGNVSLSGTSNAGGNINVKGSANVGADNINTSKGQLIAGGTLNLNTSGALTNTQGAIQSQSGTTVTANTIDNTAGSIQTAGAGDLTLDAQGNVLNNGGTLQTNNGVLKATAAAIDNSNGKIIANNNSSINLTAKTGALNNQSGTIQANNGNLAATANSINNTSGTIATLNGGSTTLNTAGALNNAQGNIQSANGLTINAASLDNTAGTVQTTDAGDVAVTTSGDVVNIGGKLLVKKGKAKVTAANIDNSNGSIVGDNTSAITVTATGALNNQSGTIQTTNGNLTATAQNINNTSGKIGTLNGGATSLTASGALTNGQGNIQSANGLTISAASLDNRAGTVQTTGTGDVAVTTSGDVVNSGGKLLVNQGSATVTAANIDNSNGGNIAAANASSLNLKAAGTLNNQGGNIQTANGALVANANSINNTSGTIGALNSINLTAANIVNAQGRMQSTQGLTINATNSLDNTAGKIQDAGSGAIAVTAGTVQNAQGSIASKGGAVSVNGALSNLGGSVIAEQGDLSVTQASGDFVNEGILQSTTQDVILNLDGTTTQKNSATGKINAVRNLVVNKASNFTNQGGYNHFDPAKRYGLYAGNNITFNNGGILNNNGGVLRAENGNISLQLGQLINGANSAIVAVKGDVNASGMLDSANGHALVNQGVLYGGRDVVLRSEPKTGQTATFDNLADANNTPLIQAGRTLSLGRDCALDANGQCTVTTWNTTGLGSVTVNNTADIKSNGNIVVQANTLHNRIADPGKTTTSVATNKVINQVRDRYGDIEKFYGAWIGLRPGNSYHTPEKYALYQDWTQTVTQTEAFNAPISSMRPNIVANGNLTVRTQNGDNIGGTLAAGNAFTLAPLDPTQASTFTNQSLVLYQDIYTQTGRDKYRCNDLDCIGGMNPISSTFQYVGAFPDALGSPQRSTIESIGGIIQSGANGSANITIDTFNNNGSTDKQAPLATFTSNAGAFVDPTKQADLANNSFFQQNALPKGNNGLFVINSEISKGVPGAQAQNGANYSYLIISNSSLYGVAASKVGSDYLFKHLNANNLQQAGVLSAIRLGVPDYEQQFIADQVLAATGLAYLGQAITKEGQLQHLMDAAVDQATKINGFVLGQELTPEQQGSLTKDIVWMVMKKVSGQDVLVPQLYLSPATLAAVKANGGQVIAGKDVTITAKKLNNVGGNIEAGYGEPKTTQLARAGGVNGNLVINAASIDNISGSLQATGNVDIDAGSVTNRTIVNRAGDANNYNDYAGNTALIAGNNVNIKTTKQALLDKNGQPVLDKDNKPVYLTTGDLNVQGGQITAKQNVTADVGGNANIESLKLESKETKTTGNVGFRSSETSKTQHLKEEALTAGISAGNNVNIASQKGDVTLTGAKIDAANDVNIKSVEGKYTDNALYLRDETTSQTKKSGFYADTSTPATIEFGIKTNTNEKSDVAKTGTGSTISAGNKLDLAAKNIEIEGGKYSGKEGDIHSLDGGDVTFKAIENTRTVSETSKEVKAGTSLSAKGLVDLFTGKGITPTTELLSAKSAISPTDKQGTTETVSHKNAQLEFTDKTKITASESSVSPGQTAIIRETLDIGGLDIKGRSAVEIKGGNVISTKVEDRETKTGSAATTEIKAGGNISLLNTSVGAGFQHDESQDRTVKTAENMTNISGRHIAITATKGDKVDVNGNPIREALHLQGVNLDAKKVAGNTEPDNNGSIDLHSSTGRVNIIAAKTTESSSVSSKSYGGSIGTPSIAAPSPIGFNYGEKTVTDAKEGHVNSVISADSSGGVNISSKGDMTLKGVEIDKTKNIAISVGGGNFISGVYEDKATHTEKSTYVGLTSSQSVDKPTGFFHKNESSETTHQAGNTIKAKGQLDITTTGGSVTLVGGDYAADKATINAIGGNVITEAAKDTSRKTTEEIKGQFVAAATVGVLGNSAGATYRSIDGLSTSTTVLGQQQASTTTPNDVGNNYKLNSTDAIDNSTIASGRAGLEITYDKTSTNSIKNNNANINFGSKASITAKQITNQATNKTIGGSVDLGGTNIVHDDALGKSEGGPALSVRGKEIVTTKAVDSTTVDSVKNTTFIGAKANVNSSVAGAAGDVADLSQAGAKGTLVSGSDAIKARTGGMIALQALGDVTNLAFNNLIGASATGTVENTYTKSSSSETHENINRISAGKNGSVDLGIQKDISGAAGGDIHLTGVDMSDNKTVVLDASRGKNVIIDAAKNTKQSSQETIGAQVGVGTGTGIGLSSLISGAAFAATGGAAVPISGSVNASYRKDVVNEASYTNSAVQGTDKVTIKSAGDTVIKGGNVSAKEVALGVGGNLDIASVQDTKDNYSIQGHGGLSGGTSTAGGSGSLGGSLGGGKTWDKSQRVAEQSGIAAETVSGKVQGDVNLTGAHIVADDAKSTLGVGGKVNATALNDKVDKDGLVMGLALSGSLSSSDFSKQSQSSSTVIDQATGNGTKTTTTTTTTGTDNALSGRAGLNIYTPEVNHYEATNNATIAGVKLAQIDNKGQTVNGGTVAVEGNLNTDANKALEVSQDDKMKAMNIGITTPDVTIAKWKSNEKEKKDEKKETIPCEQLGTCPPKPKPVPPVVPPVGPPPGYKECNISPYFYDAGSNKRTDTPLNVEGSKQYISPTGDTVVIAPNGATVYKMDNKGNLFYNNGTKIEYNGSPANLQNVPAGYFDQFRK